MVKYKCFKTECPICGNSGSLQLFLNNTGRITYSRVRHHQGSGKYTYCKIEKQQLETLLNSVNIQYPKTKLETPSLGHNDQLGQGVGLKTHDPQLKSSSFICQNIGAGSSARIEHHPPKPSKNIDPAIDWGEYREYLLSKFSRSYALQIFNNGLKHFDCLVNPHNISAIPASTRGNVLKAMVNLAKYLGCYEEFKVKLRNHGVKWISQDDSFNSFLRIVNNNHNNLGEWYTNAQNILRDNEKLWLKFNLLTGLRKQESINSFNLTIELSQQNKLS
jgi:hypothetical protein